MKRGGRGEEERRKRGEREGGGGEEEGRKRGGRGEEEGRKRGGGGEEEGGEEEEEGRKRGVKRGRREGKSTRSTQSVLTLPGGVPSSSAVMPRLKSATCSRSNLRDVWMRPVFELILK